MSTYLQIKHDREWWKDCETGNLVPHSRHQDPCFSKNFKGDFPYPAPVAHFSRPAGGGNAVRLNKVWWDFVRAINSSEAWRALRRVDGGWINRASNREYNSLDFVPDTPVQYPIVEGITSTWNYHEYIAVKNNAARLKTFNIYAKPPNPHVINPQTHPELFVWFRSISKEGLIGNAPQGILSYFPLLCREEAWVSYPKAKLNIQLPKEDNNMTILRAWGVDVSKWNSPYSDDGIDEGFPELSFCFQKAWNGTYNYTIPGNSTSWKPQYDSIKHFPVKGGYGWYETELDPIAQAETALEIAASGLYDVLAVDYEAYRNVISETTARGVKAYIKHYRERSNVPLVLYTNGWIHTMLHAWMPRFMETVDLWFAGGKYWGIELDAPISDEIVPDLPHAFTFWQLSGDGNNLADEFDFGNVEGADIDINVYNGTLDELLTYVNITPSEPPTIPDYDDGFNAALDNMDAHSQEIRLP